MYEDGQVSRRNEYEMNLNRTTQEDLDTTFVGYSEYEYSGAYIIAENVFTKDEVSDEMALEFFKEYEYDLSGNIINYTCFDDDTVEAFLYTYDTQKNPFYSVNMLFEGESYVNNKIESTDLLDDVVNKYTIAYSITNFPEQIIIKQGSINLEITNINYTCK